jgi:hypothetical protein
MDKFPPEITEALDGYGYIYTDPFDNKPFYVGKGRGNRVFAHLEDRSETRKVQKIREIVEQGGKPQIEILRYGLSDQQAALVEAAVIDQIGISNLTNSVRGLHSNSFGRVSIEELLITKSAKPAQITYKVILIRINRLYRSGMSAEELYEATRGIWKVGKQCEKAEIALAVFRGIVREVYEIDQCFPAGTLSYKTRTKEDVTRPGRWEFAGRVADDVREMYLHKSVRHILGDKSQNPIRYVNI